MAAKSIISRPVYGTLSPQPGRHHLFVADADGRLAIVDMAAKAPAGFFAGAHIIFIPGRDGAHVAALEKLDAGQFYQGHSFASALPRLKQSLANAHMGLRVYLAGTEGLIGQAMQVALEAGIDHTSIQTEHRGSLARRMQCVHCKGITENVTTQPATCSHCGLLLLVRDHYSRRLAAFQGVCINAEDRTEIPKTEEIFR
jgi:dimethylamine monooxygenase subunit C